MEVKEKIFILKTIKYAEADLIILGLNQMGGSVRFIAKSALKSRKRFGGGVLEPTHYIEVTYRKKNTESENRLNVIQSAHIVECFPRLRGDYERLELALHFLKLISQVSKEDLEDQELFHMLGNALKAAEKSDNLAYLRTQFELKLLLQQGVLPPHLPANSMLKHSLQQHEQIEIGENEYYSLRSQLSGVLQQYLG